MLRCAPKELGRANDETRHQVNICLGEEFTAAGLSFCGQIGAADHRHFSYAYKHVKGRAVVHLGTRRHGADNIETGTRRNLIIWNHNNVYRASPAYSMRMYAYKQESGPPDKRCLSYTHDRDYPLYKEYEPGTKEHSVRAWCPPPVGCYDTMVADLRDSRKRGPARRRKK